MQVREKSNTIKTKTKITFLQSLQKGLTNKEYQGRVNLCANLFLSVLICYLIFDKLIYREQTFGTFERVLQLFHGTTFWYLFFLLIMLLPINWGLEAKKWHILAKKIEPISFSKSYKAVLSGISFNILAPFGLGDAIGRTYFLRSNRRLAAIGSLIIGRTAQLLPSLFFGLISVTFLLSTKPQNLDFLLASSTILLIGIFLFFVFKSNIYALFKKKLSSKYMLFLVAFKQINRKEVFQVIFISFLRYAVFTLQFLIVFYIFKIGLPIHVLLFGISWIFLIKTIVPSLSVFTDLATRELSALLYFDIWNVNHSDITAVIILVWLLNIIVPAIVGILFIPNLNLFNRRV